MNGCLITFEGIDGSGKSTQAKLLADHLESEENTVHLLREPGGTSIGEKIRAILLDRENDTMSSRAELFLYLAARAQIIDEIIRPLLDRGDIVILDRFFDSTCAYQGHARRLGIEETMSFNLFATDGIVPQRTYFVDCDPSVAMSRLSGTPDRLEAEGLSFMKAVRDGFLDLSERYSDRFILLDGSKSIAEIADNVWRDCEELINNRI